MTYAACTQSRLWSAVKTSGPPPDAAVAPGPGGSRTAPAVSALPPPSLRSSASRTVLKALACARSALPLFGHPRCSPSSSAAFRREVLMRARSAAQALPSSPSSSEMPLPTSDA
eukprot:CAMPEP_0179049510 /NCGR_PEP_ID=MMETSP0796-20121207/20248_1 /TAXON_ID=73915 /ORGANISM="Pyrodinium bahamense, Strain pbaha01" /LENGTH=113 /DNA_ID=CAMNT_0020745985 /DNA_START=496 /DNA_END=837 /DNA_ORIENTATION=-